MPKDAYFYLHRMEREVLEGLWKLGWRYMMLDDTNRLVLYEEAPMWNGNHWEKLSVHHKSRALADVTPHSIFIEEIKTYIVKLVEYLDKGKVYKIEPFLKEGVFNVGNQEKYLGGIR